MWLKSCGEADFPMLFVHLSSARDLLAEAATEAVLVAAGNVVNAAGDAAGIPSVKLAGVR
jgi:hypothetical protein